VTFDDVLREIFARVDGARAVLLVGFDGMVVACAPAEEMRGWEPVAAAYADLFHKVRGAHETAGLAPPDELVVGSASEFVALRALSLEYAVLAVLSREGSLGRARFEMRRRAPTLVEQL
jgi:predicted regulator of Ras-like GTPase activity (Roadblock/LC7/MglB family)